MPLLAPRLASAASGEMTAGRFKVTILSDGHLTLPTTLLAPKVDTATREKAMAAAGQSETNYRSPLNVTLLASDKEIVRLDVGAGTRFIGRAGKLEETVIEKAIEPDQRNLNAIKERIKTFKPGAELLPGIRALDTSGHTPGHGSFEVGDHQSRVAVLGDALTHPVISFEYPDWQTAMDQEPDQATATRKRLLDRLAADKNQIIGYHLPEPGLGHVVRKANGFAFKSTA